ncbi:FAS1-like dehydratase domain-containing protein [Domibacillus robiginosus]|uniref:FAS1-like dehydratase domain-containing protein n=1 Tax=Domibacillus robiginosus TaxID=1071054 RepID=UPI00067CD7BA|nr:MaoC family dehydratase N-terminal domain-containing protein [Domibacillus robiginosus]
MKEKQELYRYSCTVEGEKVQAFKQTVSIADGKEEIPPTFLTVLDFHGGLSFQKLTDLLQFDPACVLHGSQSYEYIKPIFPGDHIQAIVYAAGRTDKRGMTFAKLETVYVKEQTPAVISRSTLIEQKGAADV